MLLKEDSTSSVSSSDHTTLKQKLASPPVWSNATLELRFSPSLARDERPRRTELYLKCEVDSLPSRAELCVLDVQSESAASSTTVAPYDLAGRGGEVGDSYLIYDKASRITLTAPTSFRGRKFATWWIVNNETTKNDPTDPPIDQLNLRSIPIQWRNANMKTRMLSAVAAS